MREITSLQDMCLRAVGAQSCSAEDTFAKCNESGEPSTASRLLRSFHRRGRTQQPGDGNDGNDNDDEGRSALCRIALERKPCIGTGSARRVQTNEIDLHHPFIGCRRKKGGNDDEVANITNGNGGGAGTAEEPVLVMEYGNPALDTLQSYIDSLVELGRMDDQRLGLHFFEEWRANVLLAAGRPITLKRRRSGTPTSNNKKKKKSSGATADDEGDDGGGGGGGDDDDARNRAKRPLGALSLHNCTVSELTFDSMLEAKIGPYLAVLDLTGCRGLIDDIAVQLLPTCTNLKGLSMKNCRRITCKTLNAVAANLKQLERLDIGGAFNIATHDVLESCTKENLPRMTELHVSGLGWTDHSMSELCTLRDDFTALSLGFSDNMTLPALKENLLEVSSTLRSLAMPFCESVIDNAAMGFLGRNLPHVTSLDLRGNPQLYTMTGWYDGRESADLPVQPLVVLGRYSGLTEASVEETKRVHPLEANDLVVVLDGGGMGIGITRTEGEEELASKTDTDG